MFDMLSIFVMWPTERDCHICPPLASSEKSIVDMNCLVWLSLHSKKTKQNKTINQTKNKQTKTTPLFIHSHTLAVKKSYCHSCGSKTMLFYIAVHIFYLICS